MPVERTCEYCGAALRGSEPYCPQCGTYDQSRIPENSRFSVIRPETVSQIKTYCREHGIPLAMLDHSVGEDLEEAPMNGIYRDGDHVIVYENAAHGERFIHYDGRDEARASGMFFSHLIDTCHRAGIFPERMAGLNDPGSYRTESALERGPQLRTGGLVAVALTVIGVITAIFIISKLAVHWGDGYYTAEGIYYYKDGNDWYVNSELGWVNYETEDEGGYPEEFLSGSYDSEWPVEAFTYPEAIDSLDGFEDQIDNDDGADDELPEDYIED